MTQPDTLAKLAVLFEECESPEPTLGKIVRDYYRQHFSEEDAGLLTARYFAALTAQALPAAPEPAHFTFSPMWLAPIDGTPVMLYMPTTTDKFAVGHWHGDCWGDDEGRYFTHEPTAFCALSNLERFTVRPSPQAAQQAAQATCGKCDECGKGQPEGWALYCVSCLEKTGLLAKEALPNAQHVSSTAADLTGPNYTAAQAPAGRTFSQVYRCKIKSRRQIMKEIPREHQGWWADVSAGQVLNLRQAVQADLDRCNLSAPRSRNPDDYMCETFERGALVSKVALEYMNPEQHVFALAPVALHQPPQPQEDGQSLRPQPEGSQ